ncbi:uncharacterized protein LTR77_004460 [Saxophila tyrrhenica]|uniref:DH domain-containing protein n=1 Tax=Saxophila tyrrhenica TaxID=1690608 RepID=A0AAV9PD60_9PEZI|nr:hypothetical protein LTR77_004460 [Saxophila tyrrhenica]
MAANATMIQSSPGPTPYNAFEEYSAEDTPCSIRSAGSNGTVRHHRLRSLSGSSLSSLTSLWAPPFRRQENRSIFELASSSNLTFRRQPSSRAQRSASGSYSRRASVTSILSSRLRSDTTLGSEATGQRLLDVAESEAEITEVSEDEQSMADHESAASVNHGDELPSLELELETHDEEICDEPEVQEQGGIKRWLSTLRRRKKAKPSPARSGKVRPKPNDDQFMLSSPVKRRSAHHKPSDSQGSSLFLVTAVRSATATIASFSNATVSNRDDAAKQRARKRRAKLEELIRSEEGYLADIRALSKAYTTLLGSQPSAAHFARSRAQKNIFDLCTLHDELLGSLHAVIPFAEYDQRSAKLSPAGGFLKSHARWHSVDVVPTRSPPAHRKLTAIRQGRRSLNISRSSGDEDPTLTCSPQIVALVAKTFSAYIERFAMYEDYGANYELVQRDIDETQRGMLSWPDFDRAIEVLSAHVNPVKSREANKKRALTVKDLLIKPIQRLPRYELIFSDLCKLTPVCDNPVSNASLQELLVQLNEACQRLNAAKDNPERAQMLQSTCLIGDRLTFSNQLPRPVFLQLMGQVHLCGCLYITYRSKDRIKGLYAICVLFGSTLLLATAEEDNSKRYSTIAGVSLANATIVESDNGKGLQCYTAPYSWKLVFEHAARMFEVIMVACSSEEADVWRRYISQRIEAHSKAVADGTANVFDLHSPLIGEMRSVGKAFGKPGSFVRRMSVHRTATVGPTTDLNQVIIKNTQSAKEAVDNPSTTSLQIPRSQSVATPSHVHTLAPRRAERVRLESLLSDVWTKDLIPYPGMTPRRSDPIRASANHVIRKFSMASITSNFSSSKQSASYTSMSQSRKEDMPPPKSRAPPSRHPAEAFRPSAPPLVDFHNAPEAFLPADFELQDPAAKRKKSSALRTFTMTIERPFSPLLGENKSSTLRRAQSVRDAHAHEGPAPMPVPPKAVEGRPTLPVYSVVQERPKTPALKTQTLSPNPEASKGPDAPAKTPRKSKSRLLRLFG